MTLQKLETLLCLSLLAFGACGESAGGSPSSDTGKAVLSATLADKTLTSVFPARLSLDPTQSVHRVALSVGQGDETWWFDAVVDEKALLARTVVLPIGGQDAVLGRGQTMQAAAGSVTVDFAARRISGSAATGSLVFDASFGGVLSVSCLVPRSLLPDPNDSSGTVGDGQPKVEDTRFETALCAPYKGLAI